jgi:hypothetical protein
MTDTSNIDGTKFAFAVSRHISGAITQQSIGLPADVSAVDILTVPTALARVPEGEINFTETQSTFLSDYEDIMGNEGADDDGFDEILADAFLDIDADVLGFEAGSSILDIADVLGDDFGDAVFSPLADGLSAFNATGQTLYDTMAGALAPPGTTTNPAPPPPPDPTPPPGGGGGDGGGGGGIGTIPNPGGSGGPGGTTCVFTLNKDGVTGSWVCSPSGPPGIPIHQPIQE